MPGDQRDRRRNLRTALILAAVALVFFVGIMARHWLFGS
ncbi:cytochrome oxidase small assembly protein [Silvimonas amylolytica]|nr:cytochrome oxidase small assembly protein [Silvimonas amylolytica]